MNLIVQKLRVKSVDYSEGEIKDDKSNLFLSVSCSDSIAIKGSMDNWTSFYYTRTIELSPVSAFTLSVRIFAIVSKESKKDPYPTEDEILEEFRKKNCSISAISAEASLLVSLITKENGGFAMVTPPLFMEKKIEKATKKQE